MVAIKLVIEMTIIIICLAVLIFWVYSNYEYITKELFNTIDTISII